MLLRIKKKANKTLAIEGNPYFIASLSLFLFQFLFFLLVSRSLLTSLIWSVGLTIVVMPVVVIIDSMGKKQHKKIISSNLFKELIDSGFKVEESENYRGIIGNHDNIVFRIFYDWNKLSKGLLSFGDIAIIAYYEPLLKVDSEECYLIDEERLKILNIDFKRTFFNHPRFFSTFTVGYFVRYLNYYPFTKAKTIMDEMDKISALIKENDLIPIDEATLQSKQEKFSYCYEPPIETYYPAQ